MTARTSRRGLLGGAGTLLAGSSVAIAAPHPDAALLAACIEFDRLEGEFCRVCREMDDDDPGRATAMDAVQDQQAPWLDVICTTPARTADGRIAKLGTLRLFASMDLADDPGDSWDSRLRNTLLRDLEGGAA